MFVISECIFFRLNVIKFNWWGDVVFFGVEMYEGNVGSILVIEILGINFMC